MEVTREMVNKSQHLITDYQYQGDNVGIDLFLLNQQKTTIEREIPSIEMSYNEQTFLNTDQNIKVSSSLRYEDSKVQAIVNVTYSDKTDTTKIEIKDEDFAEDMIQHCLVEKRGIKSLPCYEQAIEHVIEQIKEDSLNNGYLTKTPEMQYKIYIYSEDMESLGVANRLLTVNNPTQRYVGEYIGKNMAKYVAKNLVLDICINEDIVMQMTNVRLLQALSSTIDYLSIDIENAKIKRKDSNYCSINLNVPTTFSFPNHNQGYRLDNYYERLIELNSKKEIDDLYKRNKISTVPKVDINKYLIW